MRFTRTLSERGPNLGDRAIQAMAALVESPGGALWQRSDGGRSSRARAGRRRRRIVPSRPTRRSASSSRAPSG
jgi:hypothetical protein